MKITGLIWLEDIVDKLEWKHHVPPQEVEEIFASRPHIRFMEKGRRAGEDLYAAYGQTNAGRYLVIFFVYKKNGHALVISAREMTKTERRNYERA